MISGVKRRPPCLAHAWTKCSPEDNCQVCRTKFNPVRVDHISTKTLGIHGRGLFLQTPNTIEEDTVIMFVKGKTLRKDPNSAMTFTIQIGNAHVDPSAPARFVNHSCQPNSRFQKWSYAFGEQEHVTIVSNTRLSPGEEITVSYNNPNNFVDVCKCGVVACRKEMTRYKCMLEAMKAAAPVERSLLTLIFIQHIRMDEDCSTLPVWLLNDNVYYLDRSAHQMDCIACKCECLWMMDPLKRDRSNC